MSAYEPCARSTPCRAAKACARSSEREATATTRAPSTTAKSSTTFVAMLPGPTIPQRISALTHRTLAGPGRLPDVTVLIDTPVWHWRGRLWSHLVSDVSYDELHAFVAAELGIPRRAFQGDHYDIPQDLYDIAVAAGAEPVGARELLSRLMGAGLRQRKPRAT